MKKYPLIGYPNACNRICLFVNTDEHIIAMFVEQLAISPVKQDLFIYIETIN